MWGAGLPRVKRSPAMYIIYIMCCICAVNYLQLLGLQKNNFPYKKYNWQTIQVLNFKKKKRKKQIEKKNIAVRQVSVHI